jgi:hypothetical protein
MRDALRYALDPATWAEERLGFKPDPWQARAMRSTAPRRIWNCSRQSGKSSTSALIGLHRAIYCPASTVLLLSPSLRQSSELFDKVMAFASRLPDLEKTESTKMHLRLANESRILSLPGSEQTVRGFSAISILIIDEAGQVPDLLYMSVRPMLAVSNGALLLLSTPRGRQGFFYREWTSKGSTWERSQVAATECPRISQEFLDEELAAMGQKFWAQEYMCSFEAADSGFDEALVRQCISEDVKPLFTPAISDQIKPLFARGG